MNQSRYINIAIVLCVFLASCASKSQIVPNSQRVILIGLPRVLEDQLSKLYEESIKGNKTSAQSLHLHFLSIKQPEKALQWLRVCALLGDTNAKYSMYVYLVVKGKDTSPEERAEALIWLAQAAREGHASAIEKKMNPCANQ